jgi:hypothetical protein
MDRRLLVVLFSAGGSTVVFAASLVSDLIASGHVRPTVPAILALIAAVGIGTFIAGAPDRVVEFLQQLATRVGGWLRSAGRWLLVRLGNARVQVRLWLGSWRMRWITLLYASAVLLAVLLGAGAGWLVNKGLSPSDTPSDALPCRQPLELRVLTAPESRDVVQTAAGRFAANQAADRRCRPVHLTVFAQPSFSDVKYAFANGWEDDPSQQTQQGDIRRFIGPQPDIWLPGSSAVADYIAGESHPDIDLERKGSIATTPVVFAVPDSYRQRIEPYLPAAPKLRDLVEAAPRAGLQVARPDPTMSESGLLATADLYRASPEGAAGNSDRKFLEGRIASIGAPLTSAHDLLCAIRNNFNPDVAAILPEQTVLDYNQAKPLGVGCARPIARPPEPYHVFYPADARSLDYPFVRVTWAGQADEVRDVMIDRFKAWLDDNGLRDAGFRDLTGRSHNQALNGGDAGEEVRRFEEEEIDDTLAVYPRARPPVTLAIAIDLSGSMNSPGLQQRSRLDRARELAGQALELVGPADAVGLARFPSGPEPNDVTSLALTEVQPGQRIHIDRTEKSLAGLGVADGGSTPLYNAISDAVDRLDARGANPAVIVFTDGDNHIGGGLTADALRDRLIGMGSPPRIILLAVGPKACDEPDVTALTKSSKTTVCHDATNEEPDRLISQTFAELRMGTTS